MGLWYVNLWSPLGFALWIDVMITFVDCLNNAPQPSFGWGYLSMLHLTPRKQHKLLAPFVLFISSPSPKKTPLVKYVLLYTTLVSLSGSPCLNYHIILSYYIPCVDCRKACHQTFTYIWAQSHIYLTISLWSKIMVWRLIRINRIYDY